MAVSHDERWLAVFTYANADKMHLYTLPTGALARTIGDIGSGATQFARPFRACFTPTDNILVAEFSNNRLQELTVEGVHKRFIPLPSALGVACNGTVIVGSAYRTMGPQVTVFAYDTGAVLRQFGAYGRAVGQVANASGIRIAPDGRTLYFSEYVANRVSMWTLEGEFIRTVGDEMASGERSDVELGGNGEIIVSSYRNGNITVFSADGTERLRQFGERGTTAGKFNNPSALAVRNNRLYVLDTYSPRVQIFE